MESTGSMAQPRPNDTVLAPILVVEARVAEVSAQRQAHVSKVSPACERAVRDGTALLADEGGGASLAGARSGSPNRGLQARPAPRRRRHLYGKAEIRPGRKLGHVTRLSPGSRGGTALGG